MPQFRVIITDFLQDDLAPERQILGDLATVEALGLHREADLAGRIDSADALIVFHDITIRSATIARLTNCKLIVRGGVGYDNVDLVAARAKGIPVANVPDYGTEEVADSAIALALALVRGVHLYNHRLQRGVPGAWAYKQAAPLQRLRGRVFGIIGLGSIGAATALRAKALGMRVLFFDPYVHPGFDKALGVQRVDRLEELLEQSHIVSPHCPLTEETRHLLDGPAIRRMPRGSYLVNTARGAVVDLTCLPEAIASGHLAGAGIDVFPQEPPPPDHPLIRAWSDPNHPCYDRVIINPHAAFYSEEGLLEIRTKSATACRRALLGERIPNVVN